ncbi:MAG: response regulator transcription factor [Rubricoccaceae bacterium]
MCMPPVSVVVADDHPALRAGISAMLTATGRIDVVGEAQGGREALRMVRDHEPDVLVLDMDMPDLSGVEVAQELAASHHPTRVLAFSAYDDYSYVTRLMQAGASGYITKDKPIPLLIEAVEAVARGEVRWFVSILPPEAQTPLTDREVEVVRLMANGQSNEDIAAVLTISPVTVRNYTSAIYTKLGVSSWREAVAWAWQTGVAR